MIFSQPEIAARLHERFECAWESLRPVPQVFVDFGGGTTLRRTLLGNIATWFCAADGRAFDVLPGLCTADEYLARAEAAADQHATMMAEARDWQRVRADLMARAAASEAAATAAMPVPGNPLAALLFLPDVSKGGVERPMRAGFGLGAATAPVPDRSKVAVEGPMRRAAGLADPHSAPTPDGGAVLLADTEHNRRFRYAAAWRLLAGSPRMPAPAELTGPLFDRVLHVPLHDPFLGIAPDVPGGEGGRAVGGASAAVR